MASGDAALDDIFPGDSVMARAMRAHDWAATPLGPAQAWPTELKVPLRLLLTSRFEMWLGWGEPLHFFYNDAYAPTLGTKQPHALGMPAAELWKEIYTDIKDRWDAVMHRGEATWDVALQLLIERNGGLQETYHTFSYSPLTGPGGGVGGLFCVVTEETERVIGERRLATLAALTSALVGARTRENVLTAACRSLAADDKDFTFVVVKTFGADSRVCSSDSRMADAPWPFEAVRAVEPSVWLDLKGVVDAPPSGAWATPSTRALIVPIARAADVGAGGGIVIGANPHRRDDAELVSFLQLISGQISGALAAVEAFESEAAEAERLRELFAQSPGFIAILRGPEHRFESTNPAYLKLVGHQDVIGKTVMEVVPEVEDQGYIALLDQVFASGEPFVGHSAKLSFQRDPNGPLEDHFVDFVYQPIRNAEGAVTGIFVDGIDVTEAHDAATALRASEQRFQTFAEAMPNHVWTSPPDGQLDWFNRQTHIYSGLGIDRLSGLGWAEIVHPEDVERAAATWASALRSGDPYEVEFRLKRADGEYRWHLARALAMRDDDGAITRWIGTNTDIHERKMSEAANVAERERIWASTTDLMGTAGLDGFLKAVNPGWTRLLGRSEAELLAHPFLEIVDEADHAAVNAAGRSLRATGAAGTFEAQLITRTGDRRLVAWSAEPAGEVFYIVGRDITEQRLAEESLRQSQKMEAVGQLTGGIAHDFNNLLQGITGSLDLVQKRVSQGRFTELDRFISGAMTSANRASALTHRLLAFSRRQPLDPRPVRANPLITSMEDLLRRTLGERVELELVLSGGLWLTRCDPNQLENAVLNLAINARDAMPEGGKLTIETCNAHLDGAYAAKQREVRPGQYVCVCVTDTGTGMSADTMSKAFEPFFTTKPLGQGTGLGLSMIYGFARQSEGYAKIYSEVGKGTTFKLYLPRHRGVADAAEEPAGITSAHVAEAGETVLVIEDEPVVRGLIVEVLSDLGYAAIEAADGPAGLEILQSSRRIDLLITDIGLPGLNGRQVSDAARLTRPNLKVLFMTGYAENAALASGFLEPGMAMVTKPFAMEVLATRIREIIES